MGDYFSAWRALEDAYEAGKLKAIGVSNFYAHVLANFCETVRITPMVNQVELHPYFAQPAALETMKHYNVQPEAWAPLGGGRHKPYENVMLQGIADAHQKPSRRLSCVGTCSVASRLFLNPLDRNVLKRTLLSGISH